MFQALVKIVSGVGRPTFRFDKRLGGLQQLQSVNHLCKAYFARFYGFVNGNGEGKRVSEIINIFIQLQRDMQIAFVQAPFKLVAQQGTCFLSAADAV